MVMHVTATLENLESYTMYICTRYDMDKAMDEIMGLNIAELIDNDALSAAETENPFLFKSIYVN